MLYIIFFIYKYHDNEKNARNLKEKRKKNAPFLVLGKKKRIKKTSTSPKWKCRGENKKKKIYAFLHLEHFEGLQDI